MAETLTLQPAPNRRRRQSVRQRIGYGVYWTIVTVLRCRFFLFSRILPDVAARQAEHLFSTPQRIKRKPFEDVPAPQEIMLDTAHGRLCCYRWCDPQSPRQPKILLVHGWSGSPLQFQRMIKKFLQLGCAVFTYDQPAHGNSDGKQVLLPNFVDALDDVLARFGPFDMVLGHSLGGAALAYELSRDGKNVGKAILVAAPAEIKSVTRRFATMLWISEPVRQRMQKRIEKHYGQAMSEFSAEVYATRISTQVLVVHDRHDDEVPFDDAKRLHSEIANSVLLEVEAEGHHRMLRHPELIESVAQFIMA